jgi:hypothetical protein
MYCSACGTPVAPGISYCNRCGQSLKEREEVKSTSVNAFLTAITLIGVIGLGIMLGGALTLRKEAALGEEIVGFFMLFTFLVVVTTEILLVRQLSKLTSGGAKNQASFPAPAPGIPNEFPAHQPRTLAEPLPSVTENTTRTLEYSRNEPLR